MHPIVLDSAKFPGCCFIKILLKEMNSWKSTKLFPKEPSTSASRREKQSGARRARTREREKKERERERERERSPW